MQLRKSLQGNHVWSYILHLSRFRPKKLTFSLVLMVLLSLTQGIGLLLLVPLLQLVGLDVQQGSLGQITVFISSFFDYINIKPTLGIVLLIYVIIISLNAFLLKLETSKISEIQYGFGAYLRKRLFTVITYSDWLFYSRNKSSDFAHALTNEIERISMGTGHFLTLLATTFVLVAYIIIAIKISGLMTGLIFLVGIILLILLKKRTSDSQSHGEELSKTTQNLYSSTIQHLDGMKTVKSFNMEKRNVNDFSKITDSVAQKYMATINSYAHVKFYFDVGSVITLSIIVFILIEVVHISTAELLILLFLFGSMIPRFSIIQNNYQYFINMMPSFVRVQNLEKECENAAESEFRVISEDLKGDITFKNVNFSYDKSKDQFTLENLNLKIMESKTTALVGLSGAGKSTIADLVMGLIKPDNGQIKVDDVPLNSENIPSWRNQIGYVAQDTFLFNDTIRNNLVLANSKITDDELRDVLRLVSAEEFVYKLPEGLDTLIGDRGVRLSGGERQRLALARALLIKPSILILDEATSNLDSKNEKSIMNSIEKIHGNVTILIIAHRLSTIRKADHIYLIKEGHLIEAGSWDELISIKGEFKALLDIQS